MVTKGKKIGNLLKKINRVTLKLQSNIIQLNKLDSEQKQDALAQVEGILEDLR